MGGTEESGDRFATDSEGEVAHAGNENDSEPCKHEETPAEEVQRRIAALEYRGDQETAEQLCIEARRTLDHQLDALDDIDEKAVSLLKVNVLVIGIVFSALALAADFRNGFPVEAIENPSLIGGIALFILSAMFAAITYTASDTEPGMASEEIHNVIDADLPARDFYVATASSYAYWIEFNDTTNLRNAPLITVTVIVLIGGILSLSVGIYDVLVGTYTVGLTVACGAVYILFIVFSGIFTQGQDFLGTFRT